MKIKKLLAGIISATVVIGAMTVSAFADGNTKAPDWEKNEGATCVAYGVGENGSDVYTTTLREALNAVYKSTPKDTVTIECKGGADVGDLQHSHVADNIIINGNDAYTSGGDLEIDFFSYSRDVGIYAPEDNPNAYIHDPKHSDLDKDITLTVNKLNKLAVWGSRRTEHNVNITLNDCKNMNRVYITRYGNEPMLNGATNISLTNCTFDSTKDAGAGNESVFSNYQGTITVTDCTFTGIIEPIKINNKSNGTQNITVKDSTFKDCALEIQKTESYQKWCAPIGVMTTGENASTNINVTNCSFDYSNGGSAGNGDIRLGAKEKATTPNVKLNISDTAAEVQIQKFNSYTITKTVKKTDTETIGFSTVNTDPEILKESLCVRYANLDSAVFEDGGVAEPAIKVTLFAGVDSLDYDSVGFKVTVNGLTETFPITKVYTSVKTMYEGEAKVFEPSAFGKDVQYIFGQTIKFPATSEFANAGATWTPYAIKKNGEKITVNTFTIEKIFTGNLEGTN